MLIVNISNASQFLISLTHLFQAMDCQAPELVSRSWRRSYRPSSSFTTISFAAISFTTISFTAISNDFVRRSFFFCLLIIATQFPVLAQDTPVLARVCAQDNSGNLPLPGTTIVAQVGEKQPVAGTTGSDGCVVIEIEPPTSTSTEDESFLGRGFQVAAPYPNPVQRDVSIPFSTDMVQPISFALYDITGREVAPAFDAQITAGLHRFSVDMGGLVPGLYVYRIQGPNGVASGKVVKVSGSNGSQTEVVLNAGAENVPEFPVARSSASINPPPMTVQFDAVRQGYQSAHVTREVNNGTEILLEMNSLMPGVPSAPLLMSPANGAVGVDDASVIASWVGDNLSASYAIQVSQSSGFVSVDFQLENLPTPVTTIAGLDPSTTYFWRTRATGTDGTSEWSLTYRFTTVDNTLPVPDVPGLLSPSNGAQNVILPTTSLSWTAMNDALNYDVQLATSDDFAALVLDAQAIPGTSVTTPELTGGQIYYWRVKANGEGGSSDWSQAYSFQTELVGSTPAVPQLVAPFDGATDQPTANLLLTWSTAAGASTYNVQVSTQPDFSTITIQLSGISTNLVAIFELETSQQYYWRVQSSGPGGLSDWSAPFGFTTEGASMSLTPPVLLAPSNGATGISPGSVGFSWEAVSGALNYDVQVSTVEDFSVVVQEKGDVEGASVVVEGLVANTMHYWRARAKDAGDSSNWSDAFSFTTGEGGSTNEMIALDLMSPSDTYYGLHGGLVDNGEPAVTASNGKIIIVAISMSNGHQEFSRFAELYENHADVSNDIVMINCATPGSAIERWIETNADQWPECKAKVTKKYSLDQVKVVWAKNADQFTEHGRTLPDPQADYYDLVDHIGALMQRIHAEFPSVQAVFNSSRIWGGYVTGEKQAARGEPISYEGGFATNTVIEQFQQGQLPNAPPWIGWGPYIWANGLTPNGSGIFWDRTDFQGNNGDNQHPSINGSTKVADALHDFFMQYDWYKQ